MSDLTDDTPDEPTAAGQGATDPVGPASKPRPTSAASRARRIGGRAAPAAQSGAEPSAAVRGTTTTADRDDRTDPSPAVKAAVDDAVRSSRPSLRKARPAGVVRAEHTSERAPVGKSSDAADGRPKTLLNWLPAAVLLAGVIAMTVVVIVVSHGVWWGKRQQGPDESNKLRDQVTAAAKTCMARLNSYDYRNLDTFAQAGRTCATGQELAKFEQAVTDVLKKQAPAVKGIQALQISTTGIESVVGGQWTLLVYGQVKVTNVSAPKGRIDPFAASVTMDEVHGKWLVSNQQVVSGLG